MLSTNQGKSGMNIPIDANSASRLPVFETGNRSECMELRLVLEAAGIAAWTTSRNGRWLLLVQPADSFQADAELKEYRFENLSRSTPTRPLSPVYSGALIAVFAYAAVISLIGAATLPWALGLDLFEPGEMQAGKVVAGQWWRTVTALTLHADEGHLASNLLFGSLFGFLAGRALGGGIAWLTIVLAGALGNGLNAILQASEHTSIGASTAVFPALGLLVANALRPRSSESDSLLRRWRPLVGGLMLLALIGVGGERTDVTAHVTGFLSGLLVGWSSSRLPFRWLASDRIQWITGLAALVLVVASWVIALQSAIQ